MLIDGKVILMVLLWKRKRKELKKKKKKDEKAKEEQKAKQKEKEKKNSKEWAICVKNQWKAQWKIKLCMKSQKVKNYVLNEEKVDIWETSGISFQLLSNLELKVKNQKHKILQNPKLMIKTYGETSFSRIAEILVKQSIN